MTCAYSFTCDAPGCTATATGTAEPGQHVTPRPPEGWVWGIGLRLQGPHACSLKHWQQVQQAHRMRTGKTLRAEGICAGCGEPLPPHSGRGRPWTRHPTCKVKRLVEPRPRASLAGRPPTFNRKALTCHCGTPFTQKSGRQKWCSPRCTDRASAWGLSSPTASSRKSKPKTCRCGTAFNPRNQRQTKCTPGCTGGDEPGPEYDVPLDGSTEQSRTAARDARIAKAIREGLPMAALCERFGCVKGTILRVAREYRLSVSSGDRLLLGGPA